MVDASKHQDSNSREDDEDDDRCHDDNSQCGHTVAWQLVSCEGKESLQCVNVLSVSKGLLLSAFR